MNDKILLLCPTRDHLDLRLKCAETFLETNPVKSHLMFIFDDDQAQPIYNSVIKPISYQTVPRNPGRGCVWPLNMAELTDAGTVAMIGDDIEFRDKFWEEKVVAARKKALVVFGDRGQTLTGFGNHPFFDARIPKALGFVAPATLQHLFVDDFYQEVGRQLSSLSYIEAGIFHNHPSTGGREWDQLTQGLNSPTSYKQDCLAYSRYMTLQFQKDLAKIKAVLRNAN